jgi:lysozyme
VAAPNGRVLGVIGGAVLAVAGAVVGSYEGNPSKSYMDRLPLNPTPTACHGHTGPGVEVGKAYSAEQCARWLHEDLVKAAKGVKACVYAPMTVNQWGGYTSLAYNIGVTAFCRSSVARLANEGKRYQSCARISLYVYAGGKRLQGLVNRRAAERALCERAP